MRGTPVPLDKIVILGGEDDYRHWTYYFPEAKVIWTKYLLYRPIKRGERIWVSHGRHQDKVAPEFVGGAESEEITALLPIEGSDALVVFPDEMEKFIGEAIVVGLGEIIPEERGKPQPVCFLVHTGNASKIAFRGGFWWLE